MDLTIYDALIGELEPYTPSQSALKKAIFDAGLSGTFDRQYNPQTDKRSIAVAAIKILQKMVVLSSDSMGKSSQGYNVAQLENRIKLLAKQNGLDVSDYVEAPSITDGSKMW